MAGNPTRTRDSGQCGGGTYQCGQDAPALLVGAALREDVRVRVEQQRGRQHPAGGPRGEGEERAPPPAPASCSPAPRARDPSHRQPRAPVAVRQLKGRRGGGAAGGETGLRAQRPPSPGDPLPTSATYPPWPPLHFLLHFSSLRLSLSLLWMASLLPSFLDCRPLTSRSTCPFPRPQDPTGPIHPLGCCTLLIPILSTKSDLSLGSLPTSGREISRCGEKKWGQ